MSDNGDKRYVTNAELKAELNKIPTRWEVYCLVLGGVVMNKYVSAPDVVKSAFGVLFR